MSEFKILDGRKAIITGTASGMGKAAAEIFSGAGAEVLAVDLPDKGLAETFSGSAVKTLELDITQNDAPTQIIEAAIDAFGGLDILYNNAGVSGNSLASEMKDEEWDRTNDVNLRSMFRLCREATPHLIKSKAGRIINTSSVMAHITNYGLAAYAASKAGVGGLTRTLALELGKFGVTVNHIMPGAIRTGMTSGLWDANPEIEEIWAKKAALRRIGQPEDVANLALFLASDGGKFVTGQAIAADGGLTLRV